MKRLWIAVALLAAMCGATLDWQDSHFYLHVVMRHSDTDQILRTFQSVLQYLELQELDQYAAANARPAWSMCCDLLSKIHKYI